MTILYRKTDKGRAEVETRAHRLLPRLRQILILVDGRRTDDELSRLIGADAAGTLTALRDQGFIQTFATLADSQPPRMSEPAAAAAPAAEPALKAPSSDALRRDAVRMLTEQLGPAAEGIAMKLERAKSMAELRPLLVNAAQVLGNVRGAEAARSFSARFLSEEPSGSV
jgi:hypothetical protein